MKNVRNIRFTLAMIMLIGLIVSCTDGQTPIAYVENTPLSTPVTAATAWPGAVVGPDYTRPPTQSPIPSTPAPTAIPMPTPPPAPRLNGENVGIQLVLHLSDEDWAQAMLQIERLGIRWIKLQLAWDYLQARGPAEWEVNIKRTELHLQDAKRRGFNILVSLARAPDWARTSHEDEGPPENPDTLANFIHFLYERGIGQLINAYEIWNEPNLIREWTGRPLNGREYMRYFAAAHTAIRSRSASVTIITAGLSPVAELPHARDDRQYLREMYAAGLANYHDIAVGIHPYSWGNPPDARCCSSGPERGWDEHPQFFFANTLDDYRAIMRSNGHGGIPFWVTEFGWATWEDLWGEPPQPWMPYNSLAQQSEYTLRALQISEERADIDKMFLWNLNFGASELNINNRDERAAYSLIIPAEYIERPVYWQLREAFTGCVIWDCP